MGHQFQITKSTVECYKFRQDSCLYWADITIDAHERGGRIQIASDFGSWQNYWDAAGHDFKEFLASLSFDYAASKFGAEQWIDVPKTLNSFRGNVLEARRDEIIDALRARALWIEMREMEGESQSGFVRAIESTTYLVDFVYSRYEYMDFDYRPNPHFTSFWKTIWPLLLAEFAKEAIESAPSNSF